MIIFFEHGRTANQLFQYVGLKKFFPNEKLVFFGCYELDQYFKDIDVFFLNKNKVMKFFLFNLPRFIFFLLAKLRIIGSINEYDHPFKKFKVIIRKGVLSKIFIAQDIFFQHKDIINLIEKPPLLKKIFHDQAIIWLKSKRINFNNNLVFVHIRRRDYLNWPSKEFPAILNYEWYARSMLSIRNKLNNSVFIILGDDQDYINNTFKESDSVIISNNNLGVDLSIMSICSSGILSASSFSWWGGYYSYCNKNKDSIFIGPNFWGGYRMQKWFPPNFKVDWITYKN